MKFSLAAVVAAVAALSAGAQAQSVPSEIAALSSQFSGILNGGGLPTGAALQSDIQVLTSALANPTVSSYVFSNPSLSALAQGALALAGAQGSGSASGSMASATSGASSAARSGSSAAASGASSIASKASSAVSGAASAASSGGAAASSAAASAKSSADKVGAFRGVLAPAAVVVGVLAGAAAVL